MAQEKKAQKKRKIAIIAGSRGEYGYFRPVIEEIKKRKNLDYGIIAGNMHMLDSFGSSINEIKKDNFKVHAAVHNTLDGYSHLTMVKSLGIFMLQLPELLKQMDADMILLAGDRGEQLVGAVVGSHMYIPVAHIQAGELSGNIDGVTRHAITKFAHIHFAANRDAALRVRKMGEEHFRIHNVGAPMLDELVKGFTTPQNEIYKKFSLEKGKPVILFVYHSITEEAAHAEEQVRSALRAVDSFGYQTIVILNNSDAGSNVLRRVILEERTPNMQLYSNLRRQDYAGLLTAMDVIVGNSSSGIIEAPTFGLPAVNIGNRQKGRLRGGNVIDTDYSEKNIKKAIEKALSPAWKKRSKGTRNPYGDGNSAGRIADILENIAIDDKLLNKNLTY